MAPTDESPSKSVLSILQDRQRAVLSRFPGFAKVTVPVAIVGFVLTVVTRLLTDEGFRGRLAALQLKSITLGSVIALFLGVFSNLVVWVFVLWSLVFVPFIAYHAHRASRESQASVVAKPLRWIQLYASTFLPMVVFATAWNNFATDDTAPVSIQIESTGDLFLLLFLTAAVIGLLAAINHWVPVRLAAVRLSLFSCMLYVSLFLAYGRGFGIASHAMVFGILIYLMFGASQIADLARRIAIYDVEPKIAERFEEIANRDQELRGMHDETFLKRKEHEAQTAKHQLELSINEAENDMLLGDQLAQIRKRKITLNQKMNEVQLQVLEKKIGALDQVFRILSDELSDRMGKELPEKLEELKANVKTYTPTEIQAKLTALVAQINANLQGIPESLAELRTQLLLTTTELEKQTKLLAEDSRSSAGVPPVQSDPSEGQ